MRNFFAAFLICIFIAPASQAAEKVLDIQEVTSPGGITAWLVEDHSVPVIAMNFGFNGAGAAFDPPDKQGVAQMLSNTMDEGADDIKSEEFQKELRDLSIALSFSSSRDNFSGAVKTLTRNKARAFELTALALTKPRFDDDAVTRMREANKSRLRSSISDPEWIAARILNDTAFHGHPYAMNSGGTLSGLDKVGPAELRAFHKTYIGKNNLSVAVAGDMTKEELAATLDAVFGALPVVTIPATIPDVSVQNQGKITVFTQDIPQTIIEMIQPGIDRKDPDFQIAQVMNFILGSSGFGSRLTEELREKRGLTYGIFSYYVDMLHFDGLQVSTSTENKSATEVLALIKTEWDRMKAAPVTEQELKDAKAYLIGSLPLSLSSTDQIASLVLSLRMDGMPIDYLEKREDAIRKTTADDIQRLAKELLDTAKMAIVLTGNPGDIPGAVLVKDIPNAQ